MADTVNAKLAEWETLVAQLTNTPWRPSHDTPSPHRPADTYDVLGEDGDEVAYNLPHAEAAFIATATTAMPALLGFVEDVLRLADEVDARAHGHDGSETHRPCEALARKTVADRMRRALTKRIGGA